MKCWEDFVFLPGVLETLARCARTAKHIFIVTNQRGVGKGIMTEQALLDVHSKMCKEITLHGGRIDGIYYCTSLTEADVRRKPGNGMFLEILHDYPDIRPECCVIIGDNVSDMEFAENC